MLINQGQRHTPAQQSHCPAMQDHTKDKAVKFSPRNLFILTFFASQRWLLWYVRRICILLGCETE